MSQSDPRPVHLSRIKYTGQWDKSARNLSEDARDKSGQVGQVICSCLMNLSKVMGQMSENMLVFVGLGEGRKNDLSYVIGTGPERAEKPSQTSRVDLCLICPKSAIRTGHDIQFGKALHMGEFGTTIRTFRFFFRLGQSLVNLTYCK